MIRGHRHPVPIALLLILLGALPAGAQYAPSEGDLVVAGTVVLAGDAMPLSGEGYCPGVTVSVGLQRSDGTGTARTLGTLTADQQGRFSGSVIIPADTTPGTYDLKSTGQSSACSAETRVLGARLTIEGAAVAQAPGGSQGAAGAQSGTRAPSTGAEVTPLLFGAGAALALGAVLLLAGRRRRAGRPERDTT